MKRRGPGRPPKLSDEVVEKLCQALSAGNYRNVAAEWAGISARVLREWMRRGKEQKAGPFRDFRRRVLEAEKAAEIRAVGLIMKAAQDDPRHAEWWLERKFNDRWGRKDTTRLSGGATPIRVEAKTHAAPRVSHASLTEIASILRRIDIATLVPGATPEDAATVVDAEVDALPAVDADADTGGDASSG